MTRRLLPLGVLVALVVGGYVLSTKRREPTDLRRQLLIDQRFLDIGEVWEQSGLRREVPITNLSGETVELASIQAACTCATLETPRLVLPGGATKSVACVLDVSAAGDPGGNRGVRPFAVDFYAFAGGPKPFHLHWRLEGRVRPVFVDLPRVIDLGPACQRGQPFPTHTVQLVSRIGLREVRVACPCSHAIVMATNRGDGKHFSLKVTPSESLPLGRFSFPIQLSPVRTSGETLPQIAITVVGTVDDGVETTPEVILFPGVRVGEVSRKDVRLTVRNGRIELEGTACDDPDIQVTLCEAIHGRSARFSVSVCPTAIGERRAEVVFRVTRDIGEAFDIHVPVVYRAYEAENRDRREIPLDAASRP